MEHKYTAVSKLMAKSIRDNWDCNALSDYHGETYKFSDLARMIARFHIVFEHFGLKKGDRVAICGKNQANWAVAFISTFTYGAVPVPLLREFKPANIHNLVAHSESVVLFVDEQILETLDQKEMPGVKAIVGLGEFKPLGSCDEKFLYAMEHIDEMFDARYPDGLQREKIDYPDADPEELAIINYTSGTSGFSKGVMLPQRSFWSNMDFGFNIHTGFNNTCTHVAILPAAHMYGLMFELMYEMLLGVHVTYLSKIPSPKIIIEAMGEIRPRLVISVPLVIEKIYKNTLKPVLDRPVVAFMRKWVPGFEHILLSNMRKKMIEAFGGRFKEVIVGGAAFNKDVEMFFRKMRFPFTIGYGMTECGPIITYVDSDFTKAGSAGQTAPNLEIRIDSSDPAHVPGEIQCKGANVFLGYFKNEEATAQSFTEDGWFKTGDMGVMDEDGYLYIKGRCKCMILGPSGQNIYPEELETVINNLPYVVDSLVIDNHGVLTALVYPDYKKAEKQGLGAEVLQKHIEDSMSKVNEEMPSYSQIKKVELLAEDFERTPKKSIKRYLYQR